MPASDARLYAGIISGTSMDGIDCVLARIQGGNFELVASETAKYPPELRDQLFSACASGSLSLLELGQLDIAVGISFADSLNQLMIKSGISADMVTAIGSHGQTLFHAPQATYPFSLQIGDPNTIAQRTGITTVADFRRRDMSAGGQGAPLAPLFHQYFFHKPGTTRCLLNIGGISNITWLHKDYSGTPVGFDTGPGNVFMDMWTTQWLGQPYDQDGAWAATGNINNKLLLSLMNDPYFSAPSPKSTGRELFNRLWLEQTLEHFRLLPPADIQRTLLELTAQTIADAINQSKPRESLASNDLIVCGGGAHNGLLMSRLQQLLPEMLVSSTDAHGMPADWIEASTFAWLASKTINREKLDTRTLTGAHEMLILGGVYFA